MKSELHRRPESEWVKDTDGRVAFKVVPGVRLMLDDEEPAIAAISAIATIENVLEERMQVTSRADWVFLKLLPGGVTVDEKEFFEFAELNALATAAGGLSP